MDVLDYRVTLEPKKKSAELSVQKLQNVEIMNHGFYFRSPENALISVPYGEMGQVLRFTEDWTFHLFLFRKDAAYAKAAFRKFLKTGGLGEVADAIAKKSFREEAAWEGEPFDTELRTQMKKDDRNKLIHGEPEADTK